ncbi:MAG TPA: amidohydrolase family protein [Pseudonocardia sp.]
MRVDFHTHLVPALPDFAERHGDSRWPSFAVEGQVGRLSRDGRVVRTVPPSSWSAAARIEDMDEAGIDRQVLSPLPPLVCDWAEPSAAAEWAVRLNDSLAEMVTAHPTRFHGLGTVPLHDPKRAVEVLEQAHNAGLAGVEIGTTAGELELDHPDLREFFAAAAEHAMVVFVHPLILGAEAGWTSRITGAEVTFGLGMPTDTAIAAAKLVFGGVVEQSPELRICLAHGGGGFVWALTRISRLWDAQHERPVRDLVRNVFVDSVVYDPANVAYLRDVLGAEQIVFGTDYPLPAQDDLRGAVLARLSGDEAEQVWGGNAARLLDRS